MLQQWSRTLSGANFDQLLVIQVVAGRQVVVDWAMAKARFMDASAQPSGQYALPPQIVVVCGTQCSPLQLTHVIDVMQTSKGSQLSFSLQKHCLCMPMHQIQS